MSEPIIEGAKRLTNSEVAMWKRCPRRWYLGYYRRLGAVEKDFGKPTGLGTRVHNALAFLYDPSVPSDFDVLAYTREEIDKDLAQYPTYEAEIKKDGELAVIMIEGYLQWLEESGNDQDLKVVAPEEGVEVLFMSGDENPLIPRAGYTAATILSKLDVRVQKESDESRWNLEHKTVQSLEQPVPLLQIDAQLLTEHLVEYLKLKDEGLEDQRADGVLYNMLRKVKRTARAKPPFYDRKEVRHNLHELRNHWRHTVKWLNDILEAEVLLNEGADHQDVCPPVNDRSCTWSCPFFRVCALADDGSDFEGALSDLYIEVDPLERYSVDKTEEKEG